MVLNKVKIKDIYFGEVDGESEASKRQDFENLYFDQDHNYKKFLSGEYFLIKGRKGTGKTYLAKYLNIKINAENKKICKICDASTFNLQRLIDMKERQFLKGEMEIFWRWIILLHFTDVIINNKPILKRIPFTKYRKLYKFRKRKYPNPESIFEKVMYTKTNGVTSEASASWKAIGNKTTGSKLINSTHQQKEYYKSLEYLERLVMPILIKRCSVTLIYDDLDSIEANTHIDPFYIDFLSGLIICAKKINLQIIKEGKKDSKIILALRDDVLSYMQDYNTNLNKHVSSNYVDLYWLDKVNPNEPYKHPLMRLILSKIKKSTPQYSSMTNKKLYELLFPTKIKEKEVISYLLDNSFGRPRDIIKYLSIIQNKHGNSFDFKASYFKKCMGEYSSWFYDELRNEISIHNNSKCLKESLELVKNVRRVYFEISDVKEIYEQNKESYPSIVDVKSAIIDMYRLGAIGNSWMNQNGERYYYSWAYRRDEDREPDFSKTFVVHPALRSRFSSN